MSILATNTPTKITRTTFVYFVISIFLFIFSRIYESFSYGEISFYMHYMFFIPMFGGATLFFISKLHHAIPRISYNLWNSGIATIVAGFLIRGIINLSGRSTTLDRFYLFVGSALLFFSILTLFFRKIKK